MRCFAVLATLLLLKLSAGADVKIGAECDGVDNTCPANAACDTTCKCNTGYKANGDSTACVIGDGYIGGACEADADCTAEVANSKCDTTCKCADGYTASGVTECTAIAAGQPGAICTEVAPCTADNTDCTGTGTKTCTCTSGATLNSDQTKCEESGAAGVTLSLVLLMAAFVTSRFL